MLTSEPRVARQRHHVGGAQMAPFSDGRGEVEAVLREELGSLGAGHGTLNFAKWERDPAGKNEVVDVLMTGLQLNVAKAGSR
jgi:hypothetical protein